jgi:hypothetical protein
LEILSNFERDLETRKRAEEKKIDSNGELRRVCRFDSHIISTEISTVDIA